MPAGKRFTGIVMVEGGALESFKRIDVDQERRVIRSGRPGRVRGPGGRDEIRFAARTDDDIDGFDFKVDERTDRIRFRLEIDGRMQADEIEIGARNIHSDEDPLVAVLR